MLLHDRRLVPFLCFTGRRYIIVTKACTHIVTRTKAQVTACSQVTWKSLYYYDEGTAPYEGETTAFELHGMALHSQSRGFTALEHWEHDMTWAWAIHGDGGFEADDAASRSCILRRGVVQG